VGQGGTRARFREVFAVREFRTLWCAQVFSVVGDRLALVALTVLVFDRSHSPLLTSVAYAAGYVPWIVGALALSGLADRFPRREVMVACDVIRALLVGLMSLPGVPLAWLVLLLFVTTMFAPPFESARAAITPDILHGDRYVLGTAVVQTTFRAGLVAGAAAGGIAVAYLGARPALIVDAATFATSALLVRFGTTRRPAVAPRKPATAQGGTAAGPGGRTAAPGRAAGAPWSRGAASAGRSWAGKAAIRGGAAAVFGDPALLTLVLLGWLVAFYAIPEGLAAPLARQLGGGAAETGLVMAAGPLGGVLAAPVFTRLVAPERRLRWIGPLAVAACAALLGIAAQPGLGVDLAIFVVSGVFGVYQIPANAAFVERVPNARRAQAFGLANAGLIVGQGIMFILAGAAAQASSPATVIAAVGGVGTVVAVLLAIRWLRVSRQNPGPEVGAEHLVGLLVQVARPVAGVGVSPRCCAWRCVLPCRAGSRRVCGDQPQVLLTVGSSRVFRARSGYRSALVSPRCFARAASFRVAWMTAADGFSPRCCPWRRLLPARERLAIRPGL
jgi:MFS family permease